MKKFFQKINAREPHEKREFAAYAAAGVTAVVAIVWISTLGARFANPGTTSTVAGTNTAGLMAATAEAGAAFEGELQDEESDAGSSSAQASSSASTAPVAAPATVIGSPDNPATEISSQ